MFDSLDDSALGWACMEPIMVSLRGKNPTIKAQVYWELTDGQQSLFLFYAYYNHARNSLDEFYWWSSYYLAQPKFWSELKIKLRRFRDEDFLRLLDETRSVLSEKIFVNGADTFDVSYHDLEKDLTLLNSVQVLYSSFNEITPFTLKQIGTHVRHNFDEFVEVVLPG